MSSIQSELRWRILASAARRRPNAIFNAYSVFRGCEVQAVEQFPSTIRGLEAVSDKLTRHRKPEITHTRTRVWVLNEVADVKDWLAFHKLVLQKGPSYHHRASGNVVLTTGRDVVQICPPVSFRLVENGLAYSQAPLTRLTVRYGSAALFCLCSAHLTVPTCCANLLPLLAS